MSTVFRLGWERLRNGELIAAAEQASFEIFLTGDKNLRYQQNLAGHDIAVLVLSSTRWAIIAGQASRIRAAIEECRAGGFLELDLEPQTPFRKS